MVMKMTRAEELAEIYSIAMGGKKIDVFVYKESGELDSKAIGYVCKNIDVRKDETMEVIEMDDKQKARHDLLRAIEDYNTDFVTVKGLERALETYEKSVIPKLKTVYVKEDDKWYGGGLGIPDC